MSQFFFYLLILLLPVQLGRHFWPEWAYVWGIRIDYLAPTVYLTDIVILLLIGAWIWEKIQSTPGVSQVGHLGSFKQLKKFWPYILTAFFLILNCLLAKNQGAAFYKLIKIIEFGALALYVKKKVVIPRSEATRNPQRHTESGGDPSVVKDGLGMTIIKLLTISVFYSSLIAIFQFLKQGSIGGLLWFLGERTFTAATPGISQINFGGRLFLRPYATFPHPNVLAAFLAIALPIIFYFVIAKRNKNPHLSLRFPPKAGEAIPLGFWNLLRDCFVAPLLAMTNNIFYFITFIFGLVALFLTFSRTAILAFLIGVTVMTIINFKKIKKITVLSRGLIVVFILSLTTCYILLTTRIQSPESLTYRSELNKIALKMIAKNPVFGVGLNNFIPAMISYATPGVGIRFLQPVHNIYLLITAELGIPGFILFLTMIFIVMGKFSIFNPSTSSGQVFQFSKKTKKSNLLNVKYLMLIVLFLGLFDHYFLTLQQGQIILALIIGYLLKK